MTAMIFALAGNQNCGKTTLFNQLTGSNQHVGNFPGVTVDRKDGLIRNHKESTVVDLPGIYSLSPYTSEEIVTRDFLLDQHPDAIINILDATNIERNLYLSLQLMELRIPMVLALNMMDEVSANGGTIKIKAFAEKLGVPCVPISASKNEGIDELIEVAFKVAKQKILPARVDFCTGAMHRCIHAVCHVIEDHAERIGVPVRFAATKLVEGDMPMQESLALSQNEIELIEHSVKEMESELHTDREAAMADMRYCFIEKLCADTVIKCHESKEYLRSVAIDNVLTSKYFALPAFVLIMIFVFWMTFGVIGTTLSDLFSGALDALTIFVSDFLLNYGLNPVVHSLVIDGIFAGVSSVLSFMPVIVILFFFLSILEDSGYMARVAFVMDKPLRHLGLSGRSFVPMLIGFGCSVPAIMSTRTLSSERDRRMTILLTPFMSCSAKLPIYAMFTAAFFPNNAALVMILLYATGILVGILCAFLLKNSMFQGEPVPFVMELPNYRLPSAKSVLLLMWDKAKDFLTKAFTIIFLASIIIWFLQSFDTRLNVVDDSSLSMLANVGRMIAPIFAPLGFGDWRAATALITGFTAKEAVVSTLTVLMNTTSTALPAVLGSLFTTASAASFLVFTLLYTPCVAAIAACKREMGSAKSALFMVLAQCGVAWIFSFIVYQLVNMVSML
ncbi:ferrous iron transport protein B [Dielma fastidiosa]|uniref:Ferrous iron transport protein B n=2 Tax=Dielma fastidiosa TaxID=1034346 RepID=A0AB35ULZ1_9FIRM|nr:ferrous iron transport protein B [Dielma fastidiosa]MDY5169035.1 ferrous iron transport protein B [Dielma fastidiosa]